MSIKIKIITIFLTAAVLAAGGFFGWRLLHVKLLGPMKETEETLAAYIAAYGDSGSMVHACIVTEDQPAGKQILAEDLQEVSLPGLYTGSLITDPYAVVGMYYRSDVSAGGYITDDMVMAFPVEDDERAYDVLTDFNPIGLMPGNYVDIRINLPTGEDYIRRYIPGVNDMQMGDEIKRVRDKYKTYTGLYFRFWFVGIAFAAGAACWQIPRLMLRARAYFVKTEAEDDFMQLQTLVGILTYTNVDTLSVLEQMSQQSTVHKDILLQAYHNLPSAPEMELERLKDRVGLEDFKWFVDKLKMTVSDLPLRDAFSSLISERESFARLRRIAMEATITKKQSVCSLLAIAPMVLFILGEFVIPLGILGWTELSAAQNSI